MEQLAFNKERHIKYWQRCFKSVLPNEYTSNDSSRILLGWLILAALDLLDVPIPMTATPLEPSQSSIRDWILSCQHPNGGFCGSPNHKYPPGCYTAKRDIDPANLPATYFAVLSLAYVGGLGSVDRQKCLKWLRTLQRSDGSFGELVEDEESGGRIGGGRDMRYCHFATQLRFVLRGDMRAQVDQWEDIDIDALVRHMKAGETYDGGVGETSDHEAHGKFILKGPKYLKRGPILILTAGYAYCAIASLATLDRLPLPTPNPSGSGDKLRGMTNLPLTIRWLLSRQQNYKSGDQEDSDDDDEEVPMIEPAHNTLVKTGKHDIQSLAALSIEEAQLVGCNGRCNKKVDTCYCWYVGGALKIIGQDKLMNKVASRRFLLEQTQHRIGGFGKGPGYPPDLYHSYLGLAALAVMGEPTLKELDPILCISMDARRSLEENVKEILVPRHAYWKKGKMYFVSEIEESWKEKIAEDAGPADWACDLDE